MMAILLVNSRCSHFRDVCSEGFYLYLSRVQPTEDTAKDTHPHACKVRQKKYMTNHNVPDWHTLNITQGIMTYPHMLRSPTPHMLK